ncbi:MAG TPA: bifunctional DNA-formamidopyrimidine glycosylase/DNA-(apurinic or apyrimidinic site) lyase [Candidatus Acidoferrales bacterium]|nr:bifunctional DNA-formamidopyrimidine glycosylase/DNA-(apurinic or apyrimidinic site) lyase [Candidatus Acidoferrales bacterium]
MPELPEVETVVRGLRAALPGRTIAALRLGKTDFIDDVERLETTLPGSRIEEVLRFGKFIGVRLAAEISGNGRQRSTAKSGCATSHWLLVHLGMTGQFVVCRPDSPDRPHTHVWLALDDARELRYTDARRFGRMRLIPAEELPAFLSRLGSEPLDVPFAEFSAALERRARIKALLLDQHVFRGLGNIYTDESLWRARIHPKRLGARLAPAERRALYSAVRRVLADAIRLRGSSISDFVDSAGSPGDYQRRHRAYGREGKPCYRCGKSIRRVIVAGRSSYFCPRCQPAPRGRIARPHARPGRRD